MRLVMYRRAGHYVVAEFGPAGVDIWQEVRTPGGKHSHPLDTTLSHYEMAALCDGWRKFMNERLLEVRDALGLGDEGDISNDEANSAYKARAERAKRLCGEVLKMMRDNHLLDRYPIMAEHLAELDDRHNISEGEARALVEAIKSKRGK